jgi:hypothetical protein
MGDLIQLSAANLRCVDIQLSGFRYRNPMKRALIFFYIILARESLFVSRSVNLYQLLTMKKIIRVTAVAVFLFNLAAKAQTGGKEKQSFVPQDPKLYQVIVHMDSVMFNAFNAGDIETLKKVFAPSLEFYHDKGGMSDYQTTISSFENIFKNVPGLKRELVNGSLEVYPVPGYGAIEMGIHRFTHTENGKQVVGTYKFVHTWQFKDGEWKTTRVVSVGH